MPSITLTKLNSVTLDTHIREDAPTSTFGTGTLITVGALSSTTKKRSLIKFDLGLIPNDAIINSATLSLNAFNNIGRTVGVHRVTSAWDNNATWNTPPSHISTASTSKLINATGAHAFDIKSLVQSWVDGTTSNFGVMLKDSSEATATTEINFNSFDNASNQPTLTIDYTIPTTGKKQVEVVATAKTDSGSSVPSKSFALPTGWAIGDLLVAHIVTSNSTAINIPAGWSTFCNYISSHRTIIAYKFAASGETAPVFSTSGTTEYMQGQVTAFRNVKPGTSPIGNYRGINALSSYSPNANITATVDNALMVLLNSTNVTANSFSPLLSYAEKYDSYGATSGFELSCRYLYNNRTQTTTDMTTGHTAGASGVSAAFWLEPQTNNPPTLTLSSPADNQTLSEGNALPVQGTASETDLGNVVTVKYKINNGTTRALQSGVSDGSSPISFAKTLTYSNKRLYDGATDVAGADLAENTDHTITVWSEDDQGGKSADVIRTFRVVWNRPPVISGTNENLGTILVPPTKNYSVTEPETDTFTITEKINGTVIDSFIGVAGRQETITIPHDLWIRLDLGIQHSLTVEATDSKNLKSTRTYTFVRTETHIEFLLDFDNPEVAAHFTPDGMPERMLLTLERYIPEGASIESVKVCNNALDANPFWEDATSAVSNGRGYLFTNQTKTAADWRINIWVIIAKGTAAERVRLNGYGGAYD